MGRDPSFIGRPGHEGIHGAIDGGFGLFVRVAQAQGFDGLPHFFTSVFVKNPGDRSIASYESRLNQIGLGAAPEADDAPEPELELMAGVASGLRVPGVDEELPGVAEVPVFFLTIRPARSDSRPPQSFR